MPGEKPTLAAIPTKQPMEVFGMSSTKVKEKSPTLAYIDVCIIAS